jgi:hypothetical protein
LLPAMTLPKLRLAGFEVRAPGLTPVPLTGTVRFAAEAFEEMVSVPDALPEVAGLKLTLKLVLCPAASVNGVVIPLRLNPLPLMPTSEIVALVPPAFVNVSVRL